MMFTFTAAIVGVVLTKLVQGGILEPRNACNANNCARAVTGTRDKIPDLTSRRELCSSFLLTTVTPATTTSTITVTPKPTTVTVTATQRWVYPRGVEEKRAVAAPVTVVPTAVPAYASSCPDASAYRSACSCWGVASSITEAPTPTAFTTTTLPTSQVTTTVTVRCNGQAPKGCHVIPNCLNGPGLCDCANDTQGNPFCFKIFDDTLACSRYPSCTHNSHCLANERCLAVGGTCCPDTRCFAEAIAGECPNRSPPVLARRLLLGLVDAADMAERREMASRSSDNGIEYPDIRGPGIVIGS